MTPRHGSAVVSLLVGSTLLLTGCGSNTPSASGDATTAASAAPTASTASTPSAAAGVDVAPLLVAAFGRITSGEESLSGTLVVGDVQATFTGTEAFNGPDQSSTTATTIAGSTTSEAHVRVAGARFVQHAGGPWLIDSSTPKASDMSAAIKAALGAARDLDVATPADGNHRVEATGQPFDPVGLGFASGTVTNATATYTFIAKPDGTPVSVSLKATWHEDVDAGPRDGSLELDITFTGLDTKPTIARPKDVWTPYTSSRYAFELAYPSEFDYSKEKGYDAFVGPSSNFITVNRIKLAGGYTLNALASFELAADKRFVHAKSATNDAITIDGEKARLITTIGTASALGPGKFVFYDAVVIHGSYVYYVTWTDHAENAKAAQASFQLLLATVTFD